MIKTSMAAITNGIIKRNLRIADFVLTETYHEALTCLRTHDHEHANINIPIEGYLDETVERSSYRCDSFSSLLKPAGAKHSNRYGRKQTRCLIVEFLPQFAEHDAHRNALSEIKHASSPESRNVAKQTWTEFCVQDSAAALMIEGLIIEFLARQLRSRQVSIPMPRWLKQCREILEANLHEPPSITELSLRLGVDRAYLTKQLTNCFGMPPGSYLRRRRIERAQELLRTTNRPLCDVAVETGFYDQSHFSRVFAAQTGCTPLEFRRAYRPQTSHNSTSLQD